MKPSDTFRESLEKLQNQFSELNFKPRKVQFENQCEILYSWPGKPTEDILISVHKSSNTQEIFHRHDFFYFNYTYQGQYESLSYRYDHKITINENELYAGQPFAGHALCVHDNRETIIIGVLIKRDTFFRSFLPLLSNDSRLFRFFIDPSTHHYSEEFIHFKIENNESIRTLLEMMIVEYTCPKEDTQAILKPLVLAFLMQVTREYRTNNPLLQQETLCEQIIRYMNEHIGHVSLKDIAGHFSYHPNYLSSVLKKETSKTFSELLNRQRMERAAVLLKGTTLPVEEIAYMLGFSNSSNFYKAFREYYHVSPREYAKKQMI